MDDETRVRLGATFDAVADGYDARPQYPDAVYTLLAERCGCRPGSHVLEVGPATGLVTMRLLEMGAEVTAVEPGPALAQRLRERGAGRPLEVVIGSFESADLPAASFDLVAAATSFHWVDPELGLAKPRVTCDREDGSRCGGRSSAIHADPTRSISQSDQCCSSSRPIFTSIRSPLRPYGLDAPARVAEIDATGAFGPVEHHVIEWEGHHDAEGIRRLFATFSPWLALPEDQRTATLDALERIARDDFDDDVIRPYQASMFLAQRR